MEINKEFQINRAIKAPIVFVIGIDGSRLGELPIKEALRIAEESQLDLVQVSPGDAKNNKPPACRIMDYGKFCYEQDKKSKEAKKKQKVVDIKEIRLSVNIDVGDFQTKVKHARDFLKKGKKIKVSIRFRGRENSNPSRGYEIMNRFEKACSVPFEEELENSGDIVVVGVESPAKLEGKTMIMVLSAKTSANKARQRETPNTRSM